MDTQQELIGPFHTIWSRADDTTRYFYFICDQISTDIHEVARAVAGELTRVMPDIRLGYIKRVKITIHENKDFAIDAWTRLRLIELLDKMSPLALVCIQPGTNRFHEFEVLAANRAPRTLACSDMIALQA